MLDAIPSVVIVNSGSSDGDSINDVTSKKRKFAKVTSDKTKYDTRLKFLKERLQLNPCENFFHFSIAYCFYEDLVYKNIFAVNVNFSGSHNIQKS